MLRKVWSILSWRCCRSSRSAAPATRPSPEDSRLTSGSFSLRYNGARRRDVEPVLDAGWKIHRRIEPGLEKTKDVMKKGLTFTGYLAALGGIWWLDQALYDDTPSSTGTRSDTRSASGGEPKERTKEATIEPGRGEREG